MSRELIFYPAFKDKKTSKYIPLLYDITGEPADILWRSQSFIDMNFFLDKLQMIPKEELSEKFAWMADRFSFCESHDQTYAYELSINALEHYADNGIVSGYCLIDEVIAYHESDWPQEYLYWEMQKPISADVYAELPDLVKQDYVKFQAIDEYSAGYICSILLEVLDDLYVPYDYEGERCIIVDYSF